MNENKIHDVDSFFKKENTVLIFLSKDLVLEEIENEHDLVLNGCTNQQSKNIRHEEIP